MQKKKCPPYPQAVAKKPERYLSCKTPSPQEHGVSTPLRDPQPRATEMGRRDHIVTGSEKSVGI